MNRGLRVFRISETVIEMVAPPSFTLLITIDILRLSLRRCHQSLSMVVPRRATAMSTQELVAREEKAKRSHFLGCRRKHVFKYLIYSSKNWTSAVTSSSRELV